MMEEKRGERDGEGGAGRGGAGGCGEGASPGIPERWSGGEVGQGGKVQGR